MEKLMMARKFLLSILLTRLIGLSSESDCVFYKTARSPKLIGNRDFGDMHILQHPGIQNATTCKWVFSSPKNFILNVLFINSTFSSGQQKSVCDKGYVKIRQRGLVNGTILNWQPYCGQRELPDISINGSVEIEIDFTKDVDNRTSITVYIEASSRDCGGAFDENAYAIRLSYNARKFNFASSGNIAHCVWFFKFSSKRSVNVIPTYFDLAINLNGGCRSYKEFFSIRRWSDAINGFQVDVERCSEITQLPKIFNSSLAQRFALTIHSEYQYRHDEIFEAIYFPTSKGNAKEARISGIYQEYYSFNSSSKLNTGLQIDGLLLVKSRQITKDYIFMLLHDIISGCEGAIIKAWTFSKGSFQMNKTIDVRGNTGSRVVLVAEKAVMIFFRFRMSEELTGLKVSYFTTNKVCGGISTAIPGKNLSVISPSDGPGSYPNKASCRWAITAEKTTTLAISTLYMSLEHHSSCNYDYVDIYRGFRSSRTKIKRICKPLKSAIIVKGDTFIYFRSDYLYNQYDGFEITIRAIQDSNSTTNSTPTAPVRQCSKTTQSTIPTTTQATTPKAKRMTTLRTNVKNLTKITTSNGRRSTFMTSSTRDSNSSLNRQTSSSRTKVYLVAILPSIAGLVFIISVAAILIRRKRSQTQTESKKGTSDTNCERKRQNSTMPLVFMDDLRKPSLPENSFDAVILENTHGEAINGMAEAENPYYASNSDVIKSPAIIKDTQETTNPYYVPSAGETTQPLYDYADVIENVYAEPTKGSQHGEYSYAEAPSRAGNAEDKRQSNVYDYADEYTAENEYEI